MYVYMYVYVYIYIFVSLNGTACMDSLQWLNTWVPKVYVVYMHSDAVLVSNFFSGLHVPRVMKPPSLGFFWDGLLLYEV
jgi:hypothetical protein